MARAMLFACTGVAYFVFWFVTRPSAEMTASMTEWPNVLWFSATILTLAVALPVFGRIVGGRWVVRLASIAGAGSGLSSVANILEDGLRVEAAFYAFILGSYIQVAALAGLTVALAMTTTGRGRLAALIPAGTLAGLLLFPVAGGPIMLVTWLVAAGAALALARPSRSARQTAPIGP